MASRLVPLIAVCAALAAGCGGAAARTNNAATSGAPFVESVQKSHARLWAVGDSAGGSHASEVARLITQGRPDRLLYLGDVYPDGSSFAAYARTYGALKSRTAPTPGNHDWGPGYRRYWNSPPEWYSFRAAGWQIISLNSETSRRGAQLTWLRAQLRARSTCRIAFWHRPRISAGMHGDQRDMDPYWQALEGHARLVISGHDHDMQRFAPVQDLIQLVAGAGGMSHYRVNRARKGLQFADDTHWGALRIDLARGSAKTSFVSTDGRALNSRTVACAP